MKIHIKNEKNHMCSASYTEKEDTLSYAKERKRMQAGGWVMCSGNQGQRNTMA